MVRPPVNQLRRARRLSLPEGIRRQRAQVTDVVRARDADGLSVLRRFERNDSRLPGCESAGAGGGPEGREPRAWSVPCNQTSPLAAPAPLDATKEPLAGPHSSQARDRGQSRHRSRRRSPLAAKARTNPMPKQGPAPERCQRCGPRSCPISAAFVIAASRRRSACRRPSST